MRVVWHRKLKSALLIQTKFRANHNLLEPRRQRLLAERYESQVEAQKQHHKNEALKARMNGHKVLKSEMNCLLDEVMVGLQNISSEPEEYSQVRHGCLPIEGGWLCHGINCFFENEPLQDRCELCLKLRPRESLALFKN